MNHKALIVALNWMLRVKFSSCKFELVASHMGTEIAQLVLANRDRMVVIVVSDSTDFVSKHGSNKWSDSRYQWSLSPGNNLLAQILVCIYTEVSAGWKSKSISVIAEVYVSCWDIPWKQDACRIDNEHTTHNIRCRLHSYSVPMSFNKCHRFGFVSHHEDQLICKWC